MPGLEDAGEGEVTVLANQSTDVAVIDADVGVAGRVERVGVGVVDGERDLLAGGPITSVIPVTVDEGNFGAVVEKVCGPHLGP